MSKIITLLYLAVTLLLVAACEQDLASDSLQPDDVKKEVTFSAIQTGRSQTRATDVAFQGGDEIGIFVVKRTNPNTPGILEASGNYADNKRYCIDSKGQLQPYSEENKILLTTADNFDFYAYYPYRENTFDPTRFAFSVNQLQNTEDNYTQSDFMLASNLAGSNTQNVTLQFKRKFALVEINFEKVTGKTISSPRLYRAKNSAIVNIATEQASTQTATSTIYLRLHQETEYYNVYRAIVPVQELTGDFLFSFDVNEETVYYKATTVTPLAEGRKSVYLLNLQYRIETAIREIGTGTTIGDGVYKHGTTVEITAIPDKNHIFEGWYESDIFDGEETLEKISTIPTYTFQAVKSVRMIAMTSPIYRNINIEISTVGINRGGYTLGAGLVRQGQNAPVTAIPYAGYNFDGWYEDNKLLSTDKEYTFTVPARDVNLEARFSQSFKVTLNATRGGAVFQTNSNGIYLPNEECTITAVPAKGYVFAGWFNTGEANSFTAYPEYTCKIIYNRDFTAKFVPKDNIITVYRNSYINVTGTERFYPTGSTCTLTASSIFKYFDFGGYYDENDNLITMSKVYNFVVYENRTIYTKNHPLTHFFYNHSYWFEHGMGSTSTSLIKNTHEYQAYTATLKAGEKARYESTLVWNESAEDGDRHKNAMQITGKTLTIKQNGRIVATTNQPDNYMFTAPTAGDYEFIYTGCCQVTIYVGEKCVGYMHLDAVLWKEETIH